MQEPISTTIGGSTMNSSFEVDQTSPSVAKMSNLSLSISDMTAETAKRKLDLNPNPKAANSRRRKKKEWTNVKKPKLAAKLQPVYREDVSPAQALNDLHPGLVYTFEGEKLVNKTRFICNVTIETKSAEGQEEDKRIFKFSGDGLSKKEAKKNCCFVAMVTLYGETYKPPKPEPVVPAAEMDTTTSTAPVSDPKADFRKRMAKIINKDTIKFKSPCQMLNELDLKVSQTGRENGLKEQGFEYQYTNINSEPDIPETDRVVTGFGRTKKEAKNEAAKRALKNFFDCDLELIAKDGV